VSGGRGSRRKGYRIEAKVRAMAQAAGLECRRVPLSGAAPGWAGDIVLGGRHFEVKARVHGFRQLYGWIRPHFGVVVAADREEPLLVLRLGDFLRECTFRDPAGPSPPKTLGRVSGGGNGAASA
jgi:hypothetical protein